jgi:hypothetical protein
VAPALSGDDLPVVVVTEAVLRPGGVWHLSVQLPGWRTVRLVMPATIATPASVQIAALATEALVKTGLVKV